MKRRSEVSQFRACGVAGLNAFDGANNHDSTDNHDIGVFSKPHVFVQPYGYNFTNGVNAE